jgi:hypothetical protein
MNNFCRRCLSEIIRDSRIYNISRRDENQIRSTSNNKSSLLLVKKKISKIIEVTTKPKARY